MKRKNGIENNFDDYVYDDAFYGIFETDIETPEERDEKADSVSVVRDVIVMCDDCTNQWEDVIASDEEGDLFCPLCGSSRISII